MLDVSRGRVPNLPTLLELVDRLADFKINDSNSTPNILLPTGITNPYGGWGALTAQDILELDARCRIWASTSSQPESFGHLRYWLEYRR